MLLVLLLFQLAIICASSVDKGWKEKKWEKDTGGVRITKISWVGRVTDRQTDRSDFSNSELYHS